MARVILLNGISSAGKTSLGKRIQALAEADWLLVSMDAFVALLPDGRENDPQWFPVAQDRTTDGEARTLISNGARGAMLLATMRQFVAELAAEGFDVIVDDVCTALEVKDYSRRLADHTLIVTKVSVDAELAESRAKNRGDRLPGLAREQSARIHEGVCYDLKVENLDGALEANAITILESAQANR